MNGWHEKIPTRQRSKGKWLDNLRTHSFRKWSAVLDLEKILRHISLNLRDFWPRLLSAIEPKSISSIFEITWNSQFSPIIISWLRKSSFLSIKTRAKQSWKNTLLFWCLSSCNAFLFCRRWSISAWSSPSRPRCVELPAAPRSSRRRRRTAASGGPTSSRESSSTTSASWPSITRGSSCQGRLTHNK